jgi:signal transduction histidine kinase
MILGLGATAFAVVALTYLARTSREQRTVRAHERVEAELERLAEVTPRSTRPARTRHGRRGAGELRSGFLDADDEPENARIAGLIREVDAAGQTVIEQLTAQDGTPTVLGAAKADGGGHVWAMQRVAVGPEMRSLRIAVLCLALAMVGMAVASIQTLIVFDRGAGALRESVVALGGNLRAVVTRPKLRELAEVADGLDSLARDLSRAEDDKVRLLQELSEHERWAALGRVVAGVAHEVRNPLAAIKLRTDLAETNTDVPADLRDDFALIGSEVARLDRLVRDLLLLADRKPATRAQADLAELVTERASLLRPWAAERGVTLGTSGHGSALVDRDAVTRVVDNLLRNAVEASPAGATVSTRVVEDRGKTRVIVSDAGGGVATENETRVFEPFFTTKPSGTGLGLALSRSVAEAHGGSLHHARREGLTEFTLELLTG